MCQAKMLGLMKEGTEFHKQLKIYLFQYKMEERVCEGTE